MAPYLPARRRRRSRSSSPRAALFLAVAVLAAAAACGGGDGDGGDSSSPPPPQETTTTLPPISPLTGLSLTDASKLNRPALAIKVDNAPVARPQSGLDAADVVYEEIVEGGATRFLAVFHSADADLVGPVRSVRPSDPEILAPFGGLFGYSGGTTKFIEQLRATPGVTDAGVDRFGEGDVYIRRPGRSAPNNLYASTTRIYALAEAGTTAPRRFADFLPAGQPFAPAGATPAVGLTAAVGTTSAVFDYDAATGTYRRGGLVEGNGVAAPATVIVQFTTYQPSPGDVDTTGAQVEKAVSIGSGDALILAGGMAVRGKWSKASAGDHTTYTDAAGAPIRLLPGRTWIELARTGAAATTR